MDLNGWVELDWPNGQKKRKTFYKNNVRDGLEQLWNEEGVLIDEGSYYSGDPIGLHRRWYANGVIKERCFYFGANRFNRRCYNAEGELTYELVYMDEQTMRIREWIDGEMITRC